MSADMLARALAWLEETGATAGYRPNLGNRLAALLAEVTKEARREEREACAALCDELLARRIGELIRERAEWRTGKRRVFWRVRWGQLLSTGAAVRFSEDFASRRAAIAKRHHIRGKLYRVTVRPKGRPMIRFKLGEAWAVRVRVNNTLREAWLNAHGGYSPARCDRKLWHDYDDALDASHEWDAHDPAIVRVVFTGKGKP